ncbi:hypothetical protein [Pseudomonas massiliensis]|uniref:hypothetical protein n=1 Tax=Pseudomonas massiliensis TaxID=522492 RepID=UPI00058C5196|nr:hypothetical protein [Pseudomonas massiliensis]
MGHEHEDWVPADHSPLEHLETLKNGTHIQVTVRQLGPDRYESRIVVTDGNGTVLKSPPPKLREQDPGPAADVLKFAVDEAKRIAGGLAGAPLDDHNQATPI